MTQFPDARLRCDPPRHAILVRVTHWINTLGFLALVVSGTAILIAHPRFYWGDTGASGSPSLFDLPLPLNLDQSGWGRSLHFLSAWIVVVNGLVYALGGVQTQHFRKDLLPAKYGEENPEAYGVLQRWTYLGVIFALLPLMIVTGLAMSPAIAALLPGILAALGGHQSARTVHFLVTNLLVLFLVVHVAMVYMGGFRSKMRAMIAGDAVAEANAAPPNQAANPFTLLFTRRRIIQSSVAASATVAVSAAAVVFAKRNNLIPPNHSGVYGAGETLTYAAQRILLSGQPVAREFSRGHISANFPAINTTLPQDRFYQLQVVRRFEDWRLGIDGLVARPAEFSLADLKRFPSRTQITQHTCEQGWSAIAEWTGVPLSAVLNAVGIRPEAKYVFFFTVDDWWDSLDMADALHPQTLLAYGMNGQNLSVPHGAPVRLRVERQLGYKSLKFLSQITVTDNLKDIDKGQGAVGVDAGYSWYAGI